MKRAMLGLMMAIFASCLLFAKPAQAKLYITIDISSQEMVVNDAGSLFGSYRWKVSTGRQGYNTPRGTFKPYLLKTMHYSSKYDNSPMPHSIFFRGGYAIHATPYVKNLGRPASHGCVRLAGSHAATLFKLVKSNGMRDTIIKIVP